MYYGAMLIRIVNYGIRLNSFVDRTRMPQQPTYDDGHDMLAMLWDSSVAIDRTANIWRGVKCAFTLRRGPGRRMDRYQWILTLMGPYST